MLCKRRKWQSLEREDIWDHLPLVFCSEHRPSLALALGMSGQLELPPILPFA